MHDRNHVLGTDAICNPPRRSGPPLVYKNASDNAATMSLWGFVPPAGCSPCTTFTDVLAWDRALQPASKFGFLTYAQDTVISKDFGYTLAEYPGLMSQFSTSLASDANAAIYIFSNAQSHVVQSDLSLAPEYLPWMALLVADDPSWGDKTYP